MIFGMSNAISLQAVDISVNSAKDIAGAAALIYGGVQLFKGFVQARDDNHIIKGFVAVNLGYNLIKR